MKTPDPSPNDLSIASDTAFTYASPSLVNEDLDPILKAVRKNVIAQQNEVIKEWLLKEKLAKEEELEDLKAYLKKNKDAMNRAYADAAVAGRLHKIEVDGYKKVHAKFEKEFTRVSWEEGASKGTSRSSEIKNDKGEVLATLNETTNTKSTVLKNSGGKEVTVKSYRTIDFPIALNDGAKGPMHLSMAVKDASGNNIAADQALYLTAHYNKEGKLVEVSTPKPVKFMSKHPDAIGYIEKDGQIYTLPVTRSKYKEMMKAIEVTGQNVSLEQVATLTTASKDKSEEKTKGPSKKDTEPPAILNDKSEEKHKKESQKPRVFEVTLGNIKSSKKTEKPKPKLERVIPEKVDYNPSLSNEKLDEAAPGKVETLNKKIKPELQSLSSADKEGKTSSPDSGLQGASKQSTESQHQTMDPQVADHVKDTTSLHALNIPVKWWENGRPPCAVNYSVTTIESANPILPVSSPKIMQEVTTLNRGATSMVSKGESAYSKPINIEDLLETPSASQNPTQKEKRQDCPNTKIRPQARENEAERIIRENYGEGHVQNRVDNHNKIAEGIKENLTASSSKISDTSTRLTRSHTNQQNLINGRKLTK